MTWITKIFRKNSEDEVKNPYTIRIPECKGERYVISDIHGCLNTFKALISKLGLTNEDQLFLLGDYIDKGKDSKGVIDYIFDLQKAYQVYPICGNHEDDLLLLLEFKSNSLIQQYIKKENDQLYFNPIIKSKILI